MANQSQSTLCTIEINRFEGLKRYLEGQLNPERLTQLEIAPYINDLAREIEKLEDTALNLLYNYHSMLNPRENELFDQFQRTFRANTMLIRQVNRQIQEMITRQETPLNIIFNGHFTDVMNNLRGVLRQLNRDLQRDRDLRRSFQEQY